MVQSQIISLLYSSIGFMSLYGWTVYEGTGADQQGGRCGAISAPQHGDQRDNQRNVEDVGSMQPHQAKGTRQPNLRYVAHTITALHYAAVVEHDEWQDVISLDDFISLGKVLTE